MPAYCDVPVRTNQVKVERWATASWGVDESSSAIDSFSADVAILRATPSLGWPPIMHLSAMGTLDRKRDVWQGFKLDGINI